jgi:hypothetical protein
MRVISAREAIPGERWAAVRLGGYSASTATEPAGHQEVVDVAAPDTVVGSHDRSLA